MDNDKNLTNDPADLPEREFSGDSAGFDVPADAEDMDSTDGFAGLAAADDIPVDLQKPDAGFNAAPDAGFEAAMPVRSEHAPAVRQEYIPPRDGSGLPIGGTAAGQPRPDGSVHHGAPVAATHAGDQARLPAAGLPPRGSTGTANREAYGHSGRRGNAAGAAENGADWNRQPPYPPYTPEGPRRRRGRTAVIVLASVVGFAAIMAAVFVWWVPHVTDTLEGYIQDSGVFDRRNTPTVPPDTKPTPDTGPVSPAPGQSDAAPSPAPESAAGHPGLVIQDTPKTTVQPVSVDGITELTVPQIATALVPSVVGVEAEYGARVSYASTGSGVIMSADGYILTNNHVVDGAEKITVILDSGATFDGRIIGHDSLSDVAVIKIDANGLTPAMFGNSDALIVGDVAVAIGNPMGRELRSTVTQGIISALDREIVIEDRSMKMIQTDASINPGSSGGPLINKYGQVVGINTAKTMNADDTFSEGLAFAIPINHVKPIVDELVAHGKIMGRPALGIASGDAIDERSAEHYGVPRGVMISSVSPLSDCAKKGIRSGDIVTAVNGTPIQTVTDINRIKNGFKVGDSVRLTIYRDGDTIEVDVLLMDETAVYPENKE